MWSMRFAGGEDLARQLLKLPLAVRLPVLVAGLKAAAEPIRVRASQLAPIGNHAGEHMADDIIVRKVNRVGSVEGGRWQTREGEAWIAVGPGKRHFYSIFQEYGTVRHRAQAFLRPAFDTEAPAALRILRDHLWTAIRKALPQSFPSAPISSREILRMAA